MTSKYVKEENKMYDSIINMLSDDVSAPEVRNPMIWRKKARRSANGVTRKRRRFILF